MFRCSSASILVLLAPLTFGGGCSSGPPRDAGRPTDGGATNDAGPDAPNPPPNTAQACANVAPELAAFRSNLPLVLVQPSDPVGLANEERPRPWSDVLLRVIPRREQDETAGFEDASDYEGPAAMRIRGHSSVDYPKKQYSLELRDQAGDDLDASLLGMPEEEDWVLHAPYSDKTLQRNALMYELSRNIGRYAARTRFVEAFQCEPDGSLTNSSRLGVYVLMEKLKRDDERIHLNRLEATDNLPPAVTGGYILRRDWIDDEESNTSFATATYGDELLWEYPKASRITEAQRAYVRGYLDQFEEALAGPDFADPALGYAGYIDVDTFIDYHLLIELSRNVDGYVLSTTLTKSRGGPLAMGPIWDFNGALGNGGYFEAWRTDGWHFENPEFPADNPNGYRWYERLFEDPAFAARYAARWQELRLGALSDENLLAKIDANVERLGDAAERNFDRWPVLGLNVWPNDDGAEERSSFEDENAYLREWVTTRAAWMDQRLAP